MTEWIIPCNPKHYDIISAFNNSNTIDWGHTNRNIKSGDIVYIYVGAPVKSVIFKCQVQETLNSFEMNSDSHSINNSFYNRNSSNCSFMRLRMIRRFPMYAITLDSMMNVGIKGSIQCPRKISEELKELIQRYE